jgi:hypothetical protein
MGEEVADGAVGPLIKALRDEAFEVRLNAADALGQMGAKHGKDIATALARSAREDEITDIRRTALESLDKLGIEEADRAIIEVCAREKHPGVTHMFRGFGRAAGNPAYAELLAGIYTAMIKGNDAGERHRAVMGLSRLYSGRNTPVEIKRKIKTEVSPIVKKLAEEASLPPYAKKQLSIFLGRLAR